MLSALLAVSVLGSSASARALGDVDGNGIVQIADAILAARHALGVYLLEGESLILADVDMNGEITIADAVLIMRIAMGLYEP